MPTRFRQYRNVHKLGTVILIAALLQVIATQASQAPESQNGHASKFSVSKHPARTENLLPIPAAQPTPTATVTRAEEHRYRALLVVPSVTPEELSPDHIGASITQLKPDTRPTEERSFPTVMPEATATPVPTATPTPEPTATPEPEAATLIPDPTQTPEPEPVDEKPTAVPTEPVEQPQTGELFASGPAATYSDSYDDEWWYNTYLYYQDLGLESAEAAGPSPDGYYCVSADINKVGVTLVLTANGRTIHCVTGDTVQDGDKASWREQWAIELSWKAYVALDLNSYNYVEVYTP